LEEQIMTTQASATFHIIAWDEHPYEEFDSGRKLTRARVTKTFEGDITGESTVEYLMSYDAQGSAYIVGLERVVGRVGARAGSFVLQHDGTFEAGRVTVKLVIVPGSGTGELHRLRGTGGFAVGHTAPFPITLDYTVA
jgi:hypothetical protein